MIEHLKTPWRITFDTNPDDCNLHCIMCEEHSHYRKIPSQSHRRMPFELLQNVVEETASLGLKEIIPSTMGEPLLYHDFEKIIDLVKKYSIKLNLTTNGTFPRLGVKKWAEKILPIASDVKISINGTSKKISESIMQGLIFKRQLENIKTFLQIRDQIRVSGLNNPTVTFQVTFMENNLPELPSLVELALKLGIDRVKGHHLWITWPELRNQSLRKDRSSIKRFNQTIDRIFAIVKENETQEEKSVILDNFYKISLDVEKMEQLIPDEWVCPFLGREAWIAWDGTFNVCCAPDDLRRSFGAFGNVKKQRFNDLWSGEKYRNLIRNWGKHEICKICNMRKPRSEIYGCQNA